MNDNENQELERLFGGDTRIKATLEQTCDFGRGDSSTAETQPVFRDKQSLLGHVVQRAKSLGTWIERIEDHVKSSNVLVDHDGNLHFIDAIVNRMDARIEHVNRISIKHPGKRSKT